MAVRFARHLGTVHTMDSGQYTLRTASGSPALRCPGCGSIYDLPTTHRYDRDGRVVPALRCVDVSCSFEGFVVLGDICEEVVP